MSGFKVIVVGGGPVGLVAANALSRAGIDFEVLEAQPVIAKDVGASLVMQSYSIRVLSQLGLLPALRKRGHEVLRWADYTEKEKTREGWPVEAFIEDYGQMGLMFHRAELVQIFHDNLSAEAQSRIHLNKKVAGIENTEDGVVVSCTDGTRYSGSVCLGADGVHSKVRTMLREKILEKDPSAPVDDGSPFPAEYKTLWCSVPRRFEFAPGDHTITHANGCSLQFLNASERSWIFVYEKLEQPTRERVKYTEADLEAFAAKHGELTVGHRLRLKDIVKERTAGGLTNLEEGIAKHWSHERIVLAGDACHKFTPNAGAGLNNGIQDVVALVNELHELCRLKGPPPSVTELGAAFARYQAARAEQVEADFNFSRYDTRLSAWPNWTYWFLDQWLLRYLPFRDALLRKFVIQPKFSKTLCFDFLEGEELIKGKVPWLHPIKKPSI